jgi:hypothetical protein
MKYIVIFFFLILSAGTYAQTGIGTTTPDASAQLEVSSTSKGFLPPRMTEEQRDAIVSPATGLIIYNTTANTLEYKIASGWVSLISNPDGTNAGEMQYWDGSAWAAIETTDYEGSVLYMVGDRPRWFGGTPPDKIPNPPIIGTVTSGNSIANVEFTAPSFNGGSTITQYIATSSPDGITGTLSQAGSGTITVLGLTNGTTYSFTVVATNALGTSTSSAISNSVYPTEAVVVGDLREGGMVFWIDPEDNTKGLVCALEDTPPLNWNDAITHINGYTNPDMGTGVYNDWYLPGMEELQLMYLELQRFECKTKTPAEIDSDVCPTGKGNFSNWRYWSSEPVDLEGLVSSQSFRSGHQKQSSPLNLYKARAIRSF